MKGFRQFLMRGNVIDLAVAVVIGAAFGGVISAFVRDLLTPLIAAIGGQPDFSSIAFTINGSQFLIGDFINALVTFVLVSAVIYFLVVVPMARIKSRQETAAPTMRQCPECLSDMPFQARRCAHCGLEVASISTMKTGS